MSDADFAELLHETYERMAPLYHLAAPNRSLTAAAEARNYVIY